MKSTSKKGLLMSILWALVLITTVVSSVVVAQSAKAAKLYLRHNITYTAPTCIQVTFDANGGTFDPEDTIDGVYETTSVREDTYNTTIKISTLSDGSIFPADEPTRSGYTFAGWEYSVNGTSYSDYASASDMPFTDHLYARAKWEEVSSYTITFANGTSFDTHYWNHVFIIKDITSDNVIFTNCSDPEGYYGEDFYFDGQNPHQPIDVQSGHSILITVSYQPYERAILRITGSSSGMVEYTGSEWTNDGITINNLSEDIVVYVDFYGADMNG